ncbi:unnamed protein product [Cylindrotheca closterium]|uniref:Uncharacterized protein n=1 Tax=Cylindrotheca closterium TaxID=2856 RepID=A0AAD2CL55_9STRA|nr:unnamed protein product [Cylindrotheca closterium]
MTNEGETLVDNVDNENVEEGSPVALQEASKNHLVVELKKKALACKQAGETTEALEHLKDSKRVATASTLEDLLPNKSLQCSYLRSLAAHLKADGDIPGALVALKQAKEIEFEQQQEEAQATEKDAGWREMDEEQLLSQEPPPAIVFSDEEMIDHETMTEMQMVGMDVPSQEAYQARILEHKKKALALKQQNDVTGATAALRIAKQLNHAMKVLLGGSSVTDDFDGWGDNLTAEESALLGELVGSSDIDVPLELDMDDEHGDDAADLSMKQKMNWQDLETMEDSDISEFLEMGIVDLPSVANLLELVETCQKEALGFKQNGNIAMAKAKLVESKKIKLLASRLEKICTKAGPDDGGAVITDEDLENLMASADGAASYLKTATSGKPKPDAKAKDANPWMLRPSVDIKAEVLRLKDAKKVKEATTLLQILKQVLQKENDAKEAAKKQAMIDRIQREIDLCLGQLQLYSFYEAFVDKATGSAQSALWKEYLGQCRNAIQIVEKEGSGAIQLAHPKASGLVAIQSSSQSAGDVKMDNQQFVSLMIEQGTSVDSLEGKMEAAIVEAFRLEDNKTIQKLIKKKRKEQGIKEDGLQVAEVETEVYRKIQVDGKVQLPPVEDAEAPSTKDESQNGIASPQWTTFSFPPLTESTDADIITDEADAQKKAVASVNSTIHFLGSSHKVWLPRGDTTKERSLIRRMQRKKVEFHLNYNPNIIEKAQEKSSWFWKTETKEPSADLPISHLGKVVLELKHLLNRNCIAGDFPLVVNNKPVGGFLRLCLRTDAPLDPTQFEPLDGSSEITKIQAHTKQLTFSSPSAAEI